MKKPALFSIIQRGLSIQSAANVMIMFTIFLLLTATLNVATRSRGTHYSNEVAMSGCVPGISAYEPCRRAKNFFHTQGGCDRFDLFSVSLD